MTSFNRRDPAACGISKIHVLPHQLEDEYDESFLDREEGKIKLLYMGHLCEDKGTPDLLKAFARVAREDKNFVLELAGEPLPPFDLKEIKNQIETIFIIFIQ